MKNLMKILGAALLAMMVIMPAHALRVIRIGATGAYNGAAAYDPAHNRYLVAFEKVDAAYNWDVYAQLANGNGSLIGAAFPIAADPAATEELPDVAYDAINGRYLVAWDGNYDIYAQLVNADGTLQGANFAMTADTYTQYNSSIAWDATNSRFLVAWDDYRNGNADVYGQLVDANNGTLFGGNFAMTTDVYSQYYQSVAWDAANGRYLVVWQDGRNSSLDIYGQLVNADGTFNGANFAISTDAYTQFNPSIAWDAANSRYLVAWEDYRNGNADIYGQLVDAYGTLIGANFAISTDIYAQTRPSIAWDVGNGRYLVAWTDGRNGVNNDVFGQLVNADGTLDAAGNFAIAATANQETMSDLAYNPVCGNTLAVYTSQDPATGAGSLGLAVVGTPCPAALAASSGGCVVIPTDSKALWSIPILLLLLLGIVLVRRKV